MQIDFEKTLDDAERDELDLEYIAKNHSYSGMEEIYGYGFTKWYRFMVSSVHLRDGGYPFKANDFKEYEWQAMGIISNHNKAKQWQSTQEKPKSP